MSRSLRANEAGGLYHALNRGNACDAIIYKPAGYEAVEQILAEGLDAYDVHLFY